MTEPGNDRKETDGQEGEGAHGRTPTVGVALALLFVVAGLFVLGGLPLQILLGEVGLLVAQIAFLLAPALILLKWKGFDPVRTLSLRLPSGMEVAGGALVLVGAVQIAWFLAWLQSLVIPVPTDYLEAMSEVLRADSPGRFLWLLLLAAAAPAVAEEVLFRGVLLTGLRSALPTAGAVVMVGVVFGLFHLAPQTGFRFLPTAWLGITFAWIVVVSGSLPLTVLLHFLNNAVILAAIAVPSVEERMDGLAEEPAPLILAAAGVALFFGLRILYAERAVQHRAAAFESPGPERPR